MRARGAARTIVALLVCAPLGGESLTFVTRSREIVMERLRLASGDNRKRQERIERLFRDTGCGEGFTLQAVKGLGQPNVLCSSPGETERAIVVTAHYDSVEKGPAAADNWSGASLLPSLYQDLGQRPRKHRFVFAAFAGEERGLVGSRHYVKNLAEGERADIRAAVNLDTLGLSDTKIWVSHSDPRLVNRLIAVARALDLPVAGVNVEQVGTSDSQSFKAKKIPVIDIHSVTQEKLPLLHTVRDELASIDQEAYWRTYRLVSAYLALLDRELE